MIQKIDFAKYVILYLHGGIYIDMDVFAVGTGLLHQLTDNGLNFIVFEHNTPSITITMNKFMGLKGNKLINNAVICSSKKNENMKKIIDACCFAQLDWKKNMVSLQLRCLVTTGPVVFTNCIRRFPDWEKFCFPAKTFEPYTTLEMVNLSTDTSSTHLFMRHLMEGANMEDVIGIHVLDLSWFKNGKQNWKFKSYSSLQTIKKSFLNKKKHSSESNHGRNINDVNDVKKSFSFSENKNMVY
jgi:mannosyltransferase OCH1-like enzyme